MIAPPALLLGSVVLAVAAPHSAERAPVSALRTEPADHELRCPSHRDASGAEWTRCDRQIVGGILGAFAGGILATQGGDVRDREAAVLGGVLLGALIGSRIGGSMAGSGEGCLTWTVPELRPDPAPTAPAGTTNVHDAVTAEAAADRARAGAGRKALLQEVVRL
jgi:hypothetical protein